uniref:Uncharacterized protein n=1 Tax=Daphnia galeata TaxID=27404 RepID=A0A8J2W668_9CRUS|nr:unnamed protein product [Daphnia galeata]
MSNVLTIQIYEIQISVEWKSKVTQLESLIANSQLSPKVKSVTQTDRINFVTSDAVVRQGKTKIPRSCQDLRCRGQNVSGLYSIIDTKFVETVFCDFCKQSTDSGYQILIGYTDVKFEPIDFYVRYYGDFNEKMAHKPIPFHYEMQNVGGAMNGQTGIFIVPRTETYYLSAKGTALFPYSYEKIRLNFSIGILRNGNGIGWARSTAAYKTESLIPFKCRWI